MSISQGSRVRIDPEKGQRLVAPFKHYAAEGRVATVTEIMRDGGWRLTFQGAPASARHIVVSRWLLIPTK